MNSPSFSLTAITNKTHPTSFHPNHVPWNRGCVLINPLQRHTDDMAHIHQPSNVENIFRTFRLYSGSLFDPIWPPILTVSPLIFNLSSYSGITRLIGEGAFLACYPLHEVWGILHILHTFGLMAVISNRCRT